MTSLTATSGLLGDVGASSVTEDPVKPSLLDVFDRATMNENKKEDCGASVSNLQSCRGSFVVVRCFCFFCACEQCIEMVIHAIRTTKEAAHKQVLNDAFLFIDNALHSLGILLRNKVLE